MKTSSDELFKLIKSLSSTEKVAFKVFCQNNTGYANYLKLFDAMDSFEQYDDKMLLKTLLQKNVKNRIKDLKYNLQNVLFRFLQYHHFDSSFEIKMQGFLQIAEILFQKRLFSSAQKSIAKAEKIAIENHHHLYLLNILSWKRKIEIKQLDLDAINQSEYQKYSKELHHVNLYTNFIEYQKISVRLRWILITQSENPDKNVINELKELSNNPFLKNEKRALSFPAKLEYFRIKGNIQFVLKNWRKSCTYLQRTVSFFEKAALQPSERLMVFARLITVLSKLKKNKEVTLIKNKATELVESFTNKEQTIDIKVSYLAVVNNYIEHQLSIYNVSQALAASDEVLNLVENYASKQSFLVYYSNRVELFLLTNQYHQALHCVNKVLFVEKNGIRLDVIFHVKMLSLLVHYELGNEDLLPNLCASYSHYFDKQDRKNRVVQVLLNFFGKSIHKSVSKSNRMVLLIALKKELELCKKENIFNQFDFIFWAESKIQNRPMIEILREKGRKFEG